MFRTAFLCYCGCDIKFVLPPSAVRNTAQTKQFVIKALVQNGPIRLFFILVKSFMCKYLEGCFIAKIEINPLTIKKIV